METQLTSESTPKRSSEKSVDVDVVPKSYIYVECEAESRDHGLKADPVDIEFAGSLPVFARFGNCGFHPQFGHTDRPPEGYRFIRKKFGREDRSISDVERVILLFVWCFRIAIVAAIALVRIIARYGIVHFFRMCGRLMWQCVVFARAGAGPIPILRFLQSRHFRSQMMLPRRASLTFITSVPYTYNQRPWIIEIEDSTTLFFPFFENGKTYKIDIRQSPYYRIVRSLLESHQCRGIVTHVKSTADTLPKLFASELIAKKTSYIPCGVKVPLRWQRHEHEGGPIDLLFTCSWHQNPQSFYLRGGLEVLDAFAILHERYPQLRLTLRTHLPPLAERHLRIVDRCWVRVIPRYLPEKEMDQLFESSHVFLLPAARIHIISLLKAMSYGHVVVATDGWAFEEYLTHDDNGLVVPGRYGKVSWMDEQTGILRENYKRMYKSDPIVVAGIVEQVSRVVDDIHLRRRIGQNARHAVETKYNIDSWNLGLKEAFDKAIRNDFQA